MFSKFYSDFENIQVKFVITTVLFVKITKSKKLKIVLRYYFLLIKVFSLVVMVLCFFAQPRL